MALAQRAPVTWPCLHPQRSFCGIVVMSLSPLAVHEVGLYWAFRYRGPAGTTGHARLWSMCTKLGWLGKGLRGQLRTRHRGRGRDGGKPASTECRGAEALGRDPPGLLGDCGCWRSGRRRGQRSRRVTCVSRRLVVLREVREGASTAGLGKRGKLRRLAFVLEY